jgi:uncharacterized damage-inducible protein DinB
MRIIMSERKQAIYQHLETTRRSLLDAVQGLADQDWERPVHSSEGAWTVKQALTHLAAAEPGQIGTGNRMLKGEAKLPEGFSLSFWNNRQVEKNKDRTPQELLAQLSESRKQLLGWIEALDEADFDKAGQHARGDFITVEQLCYRVGQHEADHAAEIKRALGR